MADIEVKLRFAADGRVLVAAADESERAVANIGSTAQRAGAQTQRGFDVAAKGAVDLRSEMTHAKTTALELFGLLGGAAALKGGATAFIGMADAQGQLDARMRRVSSSADEQTVAMSRLRQIGDDAYVTINDLAEVYVRSVGPMRQLGLASQETLDLTEALSLSMVVSATATERRGSAIDALSKTMQTGIAQTEELEQLLIAAPRFVEALERSLGATRAQLFEMASAGELTASAMVGVTREIGAMRAEVQAMPTTVEDATVRFGNAFQQWAGDTNDATGATGVLVAALDILSDNIGVTMGAALAAATLGMGLMTKQAMAWVAGILESNRAAAAHVVALNEERAAQIALAKEQEAAAIRFARLVVVEQDAAKAALANAVAQREAAMAMGLRATSEIELAQASAALTRADAAAAVATEAVNAASVKGISARAGLADAAMQLAQADQQELATGTSLFSAMGGWVTVVMALGAGILYLYTAYADADRARRKEITTADELIARLREERAEREAIAEGRANESNTAEWQTLEALAAQHANLTEQLAQQYAAMKMSTGAYQVAAVMAGELEARLGDTNERMVDLVSEMIRAGQEVPPAYQAMAASAKRYGDAVADAVSQLLRLQSATPTAAEADFNGPANALLGQTKALTAEENKLVASLEERTRVMGLSNVETLALAKADALAKASSDDARVVIAQTYDALIAKTKATEAARDAQKGYDSAIKAAETAGKNYLEALQEQVATFGLSEAAARRYALAHQEGLTPEMRAAAEAALAQIEANDALAKQWETAERAAADLTSGNADLREEIAQQLDVLAGLTPAQIELNAANREAAILEAQLALGKEGLTQQMRDELQARIALLQTYINNEAAIEAQNEMRDAAIEAAEMSSRAWQDFADGLADAVLDGSDGVKRYFKRLLDDLKAQIISSGLMSIFSSIFGVSGGSSSLSMLGAMFGGGATSGGSGLSSIGGIAQAGRSLWNAFAGSAASSAVGTGSSMFGTYTGSNFVGPLANGQSYGFAPSTAGYAMAGAAGLYAGYNRYQNSNGGLAGGLGAAAYGLGTYGAATGAGSMMAGGSFAAGMSGAFGAIPVVGWVALAAMVVDKLAGGKLFGTAYRPESTESTLSLANGGTASLSMTEVRQRSLFRGRSWRTTDMEASDEAQDAAEAFYANIYGLMVSSANQLAIDVPPVIDAALRTVNEYDKKGKVTATKIFVDVLGRSWEEATEELATTRLSAEAIIATVDAALAEVVYNSLAKGSPALQLDGGGVGGGDLGDAVNTASAIMGEASQIAERWRDDAEQLMIGAQYLLAATADMRAGNALLGEGVSLTAVTDFVDEMAQGAETILETYTRLSASAGMLEQALDLSGTALDLTREEFVRFAADITDAAGGLDRASALWADYFQRFYSPDELLANQAVGANAAAQSEFSDIGLNVSDYTGEGGAQAFRELFESTLPTLSAEAVVEWLEAASALGVVIDLQSQQNAVLQEQADAMADYNAQVASLQGEIDAASMSDFALEMRDINRWSADAVESLNASARAAGLQAASEEDLALVHQIAAQRAAAAIERLRASAADLVAELYGSPLAQINEQIASMEAAQQSSIESVGNAAQDMYAAQLSALQGIKAWLDGQLLGDLSTLTPEQQLAEAQRQFEATLARAQSGDVDALQSITGQADALLRMGRDYYASSAQYTAIEQMVRGGMQGLVNAGQVGAAAGEQSNTGGGGGGGVSPGLQALYEERDALMLDAEQRHRTEMMDQLGGMIRELIQATGQPLAEVAASIGLNLSSLATDLGINLNELSTETASSLVGMARALGVDVAELAANVGVSLGDLADRQSLLNQALDQTLADVPAEFREQLTAPLEAIRTATTEADATAAVNAAEVAINSMPAGIRDMLAPYFANVFPAESVTELTRLSDIAQNSAASLGVLQTIAGILSAQTAAPKSGTATGGDASGNQMPDVQAMYAELAAAMASAEAAQSAALGGVANSIGEMSSMLGADVADFADGVGLALVGLADRQTLLNQDLMQTLLDTPAALREQLYAPLDAIRAATIEIDANAAIAAAESAIRELPLGIAAATAPYVEAVLAELSSLNATAAGELSETAAGNVLLGFIQGGITGLATALLKPPAPKSSSAATAPPAYAAGGWVNGPTTLLAGEAGRELILPNPVSEFLSRAGIPINTGGDSRAVVAELRALRESQERTQRELINRVEQLERAQRDGADQIARETKRQTDVLATGGR